MHRTVICPGSFDPATLGHIDIITRASKMFDNVIVGVFVNGEKHPSFSIEERTRFLEKVVGDIPNVRVIGCDGLLAQCAKEVPVVQHGIFGAEMKVELLNDGPFTIVLEGLK